MTYRMVHQCRNKCRRRFRKDSRGKKSCINRCEKYRHTKKPSKAWINSSNRYQKIAAKSGRCHDACKTRSCHDACSREKDKKVKVSEMKYKREYARNYRRKKSRRTQRKSRRTQRRSPRTRRTRKITRRKNTRRSRR